MEEASQKTGIYGEVKRKAIHIASSGFAILYLFNTKELTLIILGVLLILSIVIDILRYSWADMKKVYMSLFYSILRAHEKQAGKIVFTGATYLVLSAVICIAVFPKPVAVMAILILTVSDSFAALTGRLIGRFRIRDKTLEGSAAFFLSGLGIIFLTPKISLLPQELIIGASALFLTTIVEVLPVKFDDNIVIPIFFGIMYVLLFNIFL